MNIKLDAIIKNLGISRDELLQAEDESDKRLEHNKKQLQDDAEKNK